MRRLRIGPEVLECPNLWLEAVGKPLPADVRAGDQSDTVFRSGISAAHGRSGMHGNGGFHASRGREGAESAHRQTAKSLDLRGRPQKRCGSAAASRDGSAPLRR
jgi:hypothetical protein